MKSRTLITPEAHARALIVADIVKKLLEARLVNMTSHGFSCSCGACKVGPSRVVAVNIPKQYPYQIAMWLMWTCQMEDDTGNQWGQGLSAYLTRAELYPMFRKAFAGIDVRVEHPYAQMYNGLPGPFQASGRTLELEANKAVYVRPVGDLAYSMWTDAELSIATYKKEHAVEGTLISCNVDALAFGQQRRERYYHLKGEQQAFFIYVSDGPGKETYLPIARVVAVNKKTGSATIELDQSVEVFTPATLPV